MSATWQSADTRQEILEVLYEHRDLRVVRQRHRKDRRFILITVWDEDQLLREFGKDERDRALAFVDGYAMGKAVWG